MEVYLPREQEQFLRDLVASGRYPTASEAVVVAVSLLQDREYVREGRLQWLRKAVQEGLDSLEQGGGLDGEKVFADLRREAARLRKATAAKPARKTRRRAG